MQNKTQRKSEIISYYALAHDLHFKVAPIVGSADILATDIEILIISIISIILSGEPIFTHA